MYSQIFFILAILYFDPCFGMETFSFTHIDAQEGLLKVALRSYKKSAITIELLGMPHFADRVFYQFVKELARNKIVVYEMNGCDYKQKLKQDQTINQLPYPYQKKYRLIRCLQNSYELVAYKFNLATVNQADILSEAKESIHADNVNPLLRDYFSSQESLIKFIDKVYFHDISTLEKIVDQKANNIPELFQYLLSTVDGKKSNSDSEREGIAKKRLKELFENEGAILSILVLYGPAHQDALESFLLGEGFILKESSWLVALTRGKTL